MVNRVTTEEMYNKSVHFIHVLAPVHPLAIVGVLRGSRRVDAQTAGAQNPPYLPGEAPQAPPSSGPYRKAYGNNSRRRIRQQREADAGRHEPVPLCGKKGLFFGLSPLQYRIPLSA